MTEMDTRTEFSKKDWATSVSLCQKQRERERETERQRQRVIKRGGMETEKVMDARLIPL